MTRTRRSDHDLTVKVIPIVLYHDLVCFFDDSVVKKIVFTPKGHAEATTQEKECFSIVNPYINPGNYYKIILSSVCEPAAYYNCITMSAWLVVLLLSPSMVLGRITVHLKAFAEADRNTIDVAGADVKIISETEREIFHLSDARLKSAVPTSARHPMTSTSTARLRGETSTGNTAGTSTAEATYEAHVFHSITNTVENSWNSSHEFSIGQEIRYKFNVLAALGRRSTKFEHKGRLGINDSYSHSVIVSSRPGETVKLQPGQSVTVKLTAIRGWMRTQIDYDARLAGYAICNYADKYKGHQFWGLWLPTIMKSAGISNSLKSTQVLNVGFYSDAKVIVEDIKTEKIISEKAAKVF
ncbi:Spherulin-2A [Eumeta japonica]|uniref:Spherulin-2A n=1 Tax=Eumeta variegata TaxID=151549 RepID=A0A4C1XBI6_EUMVA|nr:Spherulin-2A [Eumeta japonica]